MPTWTQKKIDAVVEDAPVLEYLLKKAHDENKFKNIIVLPLAFEKQNYGIVLPEEHHRMERLNQILLKARQNPEWQMIQDKYFKENK